MERRELVARGAAAAATLATGLTAAVHATWTR